MDKVAQTSEQNLQNVWHNILTILEGSLSQPVYQTLVTSCRPLSVHDGSLVVGADTDFLRDYLYRQCAPIFDVIFQNESIGGISSVRFSITPKSIRDGQEDFSSAEEKPRDVRPEVKYSFLNPRYTFDTFVVGNGNRFAHAAALAVAESPARAYNPLFIYGGVGLGKTHLMQAIGHAVIEKNPKTRVIYVTSEKFTNDLITSIREDRMGEFRAKYRGIDLLMIDDIQFLEGKERTQEEFFHTFNTLYDSTKQLVISSDRPPKEIPTLEERLRSRFEWGLTADIQAPDLETRIAILQKKAELDALEVPEDVMSLIASRISSNIRELEGALIRVVAYAALNDVPLDTSITEHMLKDLTQPSRDKKIVNVDLIKKITAGHYSIKLDDMDAKIRTREIATARQVAMYLCRELITISLPKIGEEFGGRDHTTVIHACEKIKDELTHNAEIQQDVESLIKKIRAES